MKKYYCCGTWLRPALLLLGTLLSFSAAMPQTATQLRVESRNGESWEALPVDSLGIVIEGMGSQVRVTYELRIFNPRQTQTEGRCLLPLPPGAVITGFALETVGEMREASVVDARLGRTAYEDIVRRQIDPGLVEYLADDVYRLRIFPLPAMGFRRVRIVMEASLQPVNGALTLPIFTTGTTPKVSFRFNWAGATGLPSVSGGPRLPFQLMNRNAKATWEGPSQRWERQAALVIPYELAGPSVWVDEAGWAYLEMPLGQQAKPRPAASRVRLYWDRSASMATWQRKEAVQAILAWFQQMKPAALEVVPFHLVAEAGAVFRANDPQAAAELEAFLLDLVPDGMADWSNLSFNERGIDLYLLVTDGVGGLQPKPFPVVNAPVLVLSKPLGAGALAGFALSSGGNVVALDAAQPENSGQALATVRPQLLALMGTSKDLWLPIDQDRSGGLLRLAGKITGRQPDLRMRVGYPNDFQDIAIPDWGEGKATWPLDLQRLHGKALVNRQMYLAVADMDQLAELGKKYHLVTPATSLLVLERAEDYAIYKVEPPASLKKEVEDLLARQEEDQRSKKESHLQATAEAFQARITWWKTDFKPKPLPKPARRDTLEERRDRSREESEERMYLPSAVSDEAYESDADGVSDLMDQEPESPVGLSVNATGMSLESMSEDSEESSDAISDEATKGNITLEAWSTTSTYLPLLEKAGENWIVFYVELREKHGGSPGFFLDIANWRWSKGDSLGAVRVAGNLGEMSPGDHELLRSLARRFEEAGELELAVRLFEEIKRLRPEEPQSLRDLALAKAAQGAWQEAANLLMEVASNPWPDRFPEIAVMAAHELNALAGQHPGKVSLSGLDQRLTADLPTDLRVLLQWDQNDVDMDLWVTDPRGERCLYNHRETAIGGWMSRDFTGGYGPEEFLIKTAMPGTYKVEVNYYGNNRQEISRPVLVQLRLIFDYGKPTQREERITRELTGKSETILIGTFEVGK